MTLLSLGEFLWSLLIIFFMVIYFMMLFQVIVDVFRRHDASGGKKALWLIFLFLAPFVGLIAYMITNSDGMAKRSVAAAAALVGGLGALILHGGREVVVLVVALVVYGAAAARATRPEPRAATRRRPRTAGAVLLINPRSGDGRATRANLADEAERRGI